MRHVHLLAVHARHAVLAMGILAVTFGTAPAQRSNSYFVSLGPALTAGGAWGQGHKVGSSVELGVTRPMSASWDLILAFGVERFRIAYPYLDPFAFGSDGSLESVTFGRLQGGSDAVFSIRGGFRWRFTSKTRFKPYAGGLLGLSIARQNGAFVTRTLRSTNHEPTTEIVPVQSDNTQLAAGISGVVGASTSAGAALRVFVETGYTFVFTPDDSFNDNPSFFPIRVGIVF